MDFFKIAILKAFCTKQETHEIGMYIHKNKAVLTIILKNKDFELGENVFRKLTNEFNITFLKYSPLPYSEKCSFQKIEVHLTSK